MSFYGKSFVFDGTPCEAFDLMLYDIEDQDSELKVSGIGGIEEETIGDKWKPYFYGVKPATKLEFDLVFGVNTRRIDAEKFLDRWEVEEITTWLCGHQEYKWLYIDQPDMRMFGYRCIISEPVVTRYASVPWAYRVHVICDSPYAYMEPSEITETVNGTANITVFNESSLNGWYCPVVTFEKTGGSTFSMTNAQDNGRGPSLTEIPGSVSEITIDNEHCVLGNDQGLNMYEKFNFQFLRLARGQNEITISGNGTVKILCEFPVNVGG